MNPPIEWTGWRGPTRDGRVPWLPSTLPAKPAPVWSVDVSSRGLGGVAATKEFVLFSERGLEDSADVWKCLNANDGKELWTYSYPAAGNLDYGNSPRATPHIVGDRVFLFGAFGHLACAELKTGKIHWELSLRDEFDVTDEPKWGACSSPLMVDGKLIVNPGGKDASLVALDPKTGKTLWKSPGKAAGYGSLIAGEFGGTHQIVGHDTDSLGGWDIATGKRLWKLVPENPNDFNVPTPIRLDGQLLVTTENNGTRLYTFDKEGKIVAKAVAVHRKLNPDTHTPVVVGGNVFGVSRRLYCLDWKQGLKAKWNHDDQALTKYTALVASETRLLAITLDAELVLFEASAAEAKELGRLKVIPAEKGLYAHPAFVGTRMYLRGSSSILCLDLAE